MKNPREKVSEPQNTFEKKFRKHNIPTRKILDLQNTHETPIT